MAQTPTLAISQPWGMTRFKRPRQSLDLQPSSHLVKVVEHSGEVSFVGEAHRIIIHHGSVLPDSAGPAAHIKHLLNVWVV
mmetsp:Transcript_31188/g.91633  ORF Transcript_31188/g.91633 Transcript_31188/m.91633 type:complete len:80 (+) Transcript_31188:497-736(+)